MRKLLIWRLNCRSLPIINPIRFEEQMMDVRLLHLRFRKFLVIFIFNTKVFVAECLLCRGQFISASKSWLRSL